MDEDWTTGALIVAEDEAGHQALWPAERALPAPWTRRHGPCRLDAARAWLDDPANAAPAAPSQKARQESWPEGVAESIPARLSRLARTAPERPAILFGNRTVTRGDLDAQGARVVAGLTAQGIGRGAIVAVALERGPGMIGALLGVLRAGAAFLPLDPAYPVERIHTMLADAGIRHILTTPDLAERLELPEGITALDPTTLSEAGASHSLPHPEVPKRSEGLEGAFQLPQRHLEGSFEAAHAAPQDEGQDGRAEREAAPARNRPILDRHDAANPSELRPSDPAYLIYTSGSTGRPKGVVVEHGPLAMHCLTTAQAYEMDEGSRELHFLSFAFDGAHERWMTPLSVGGCIVLRGPELWTAADTLAAIRRYRITHAGFPTSYIGQLAEWADTIGEAPDVQVYSFGGEAMARATFERIGRALRPRLLINGYGPTECVISPLVWKVAPGTTFEEPYAPIGAAVGARATYVLGPDLKPVAKGGIGELYIAGGLARGYLNRPAQTAERFLPDPFRDGGGRMYRTGDLVRERADGALSYAGRADDQVKIRGHRIELGEIEAALRAQDSVSEAVVVRRDGPGGPYLAGFVTPARGRRPEAGRLRMALGRALPDWMIPTRLTIVERLPVTANGKVDRNALPDPEADARPSRPPSSVVEKRLAGIWSEILGYRVEAADRPFFECGGDSLSALRLVAKLRLIAPEGGVTVADLLRNPTIEALAARIEAGADAEGGLAPLVRLARGTGTGPLLVLFPGLLVSTREYEPLVAHLTEQLGSDVEAVGFLCASLVEEVRPLPAVAELAAAYAERVQALAKGRDCIFLGWSWGGVLAYETARRLGPDIRLRFVGMLDACGLEANFAVGAGRPIAAEERGAHEGMVAAWLDGSPMRSQWEALLACMDEEAHVQFLRFMAAEPQPLPVDGPEVGSRERILWTLVDHAIQFRALRLAPGTVPIRVFAAQDSLERGLPVIDWRPLTTRLLSVETVPETDHLDIVLSPRLHARIAALAAPP